MIVCTLLLLLIQTALVFTMFYVCSKIPVDQYSPVFPSCMRSSIPRARSLLANTQVPVICSKCVILALVALVLGRTDHSHAVIGAPLSYPTLSTMSSQLEHWFGTGPLEMVGKYAKLHNTVLQNLAPHPCVLRWWTQLALAPLAGVWFSINPA